MKRYIYLLVMLFVLVGAKPAAAQNRFIVRGNGLSSVLNFCLTAGCQVQRPLDGNIGRTYLVTSSGNLLVRLVNGVVNLVDALLGIQSIEADGLMTTGPRSSLTWS